MTWPIPRPERMRSWSSANATGALAGAIDALPARQRAAIVLTYQEGLGNAEAAAVLDTSVSGVEALLVRAKRDAARRRSVQTRRSA